MQIPGQPLRKARDSKWADLTERCTSNLRLCGTNRLLRGGQSMSALPANSDVNLFRYG
jgi:hypothetical protein